jgi:uncharacterized protein with NRDE domain
VGGIIMSEEKLPDSKKELKLADIEIEYDIDKLIGKIIIDGVDYSTKISNVVISINAQGIPMVKVEFYAENLKIKTKAEVEKQCVRE